MKNINELVAGNRSWAKETKKNDPDFFKTLSEGQAPHYLWIGCSDSRVPANQVCGLVAGDVFVHRNVANVVSLTDLNCLSVLQYAVEVLQVQKIIVCGHYACGGIEAVVNDRTFGLIDNWLTSVHEVKSSNEDFINETLAHITDKKLLAKKTFDMMCELNALHQAFNLSKTTVVKAAWKKGMKFTIHAAIYGVADGKLYELGTGVSSRKEIEASYDMAIASITERYSK